MPPATAPPTELLAPPPIKAPPICRSCRAVSQPASVKAIMATTINFFIVFSLTAQRLAQYVPLVGRKCGGAPRLSNGTNAPGFQPNSIFLKIHRPRFRRFGGGLSPASDDRSE